VKGPFTLLLTKNQFWLHCVIEYLPNEKSPSEEGDTAIDLFPYRIIS
jgi:hypothetical protein